jgi:hypothetical protein
MRKFLTVPPELLVLKSGPTSCVWVNIELAIWCMYGTASLPIAVIAVEILISCAHPICSGYQSAVDVKLPKVTLGDICPCGILQAGMDSCSYPSRDKLCRHKALINASTFVSGTE